MASPEFVKGIYTGHSQCRRVGANYIDVHRRRLRLALVVYIEARRYRISKARLPRMTLAATWSWIGSIFSYTHHTFMMRIRKNRTNPAALC